MKHYKKKEWMNKKEELISRTKENDSNLITKKL